MLYSKYLCSKTLLLRFKLGSFLRDDVWVAEPNFPKGKRKKQNTANRLLVSSAEGFLSTTPKLINIEERFSKKCER
jgi:hypothetical protein